MTRNRPFTVISHDPFARFETLRRVDDSSPCAECGSTNAYGHTYEYGARRDDRPGQPGWDGRSFCCIGCRRAYYGLSG